MRLIVFNIISILFFISSCYPYAKIKQTDVQVIALDSSRNVNEETDITKYVAPYKREKDSIMNSILVYSKGPFLKGEPEGALGNFVADLTLEIGNKYYYPEDGIKGQICLLNNGGLRTALPSGAITKGKVFELMPFENRVVILTISGEKAQKLFNYIARSSGMPVAGATMVIQDTIATDILIKGKPIQRNENYKVITSDYLANGGDKMSFFNDPINREELDVLIRDGIIEYMMDLNRHGKMIEPKLDKRVRYLE